MNKMDRHGVGRIHSRLPPGGGWHVTQSFPIWYYIVGHPILCLTSKIYKIIVETVGFKVHCSPFNILSFLYLLSD